MILTVANVIAKFFGIDADRAYFYAVAGLMATLLITLGFFGWWISSCRQRSFEKKIDRLDSNISTANGAIEVLTNQKAVEQGEVNKIASEVNNAQKNADSIRNANYSNTNLSEAERKMCAAYPESCR